MAKVTSLGGILFKSDDPKAQNEWYKKHLGLQTGDYGTTFIWRKHAHPEQTGFTVWSPFSNNTQYFAPSEKSFMINFRVDNLDELLAQLKEQGVQQVGEVQDYEYGRFAWIMDPEGNKIELWQPLDNEPSDSLGNDITGLDH
ncbi:MAG: VOC family protein [Bacteroidia bacterium]|jgi:predicted enzyme related to lactoylglutathione lyase|nr:VOC family protein [Bacteroidia bacterium]